MWQLHKEAIISAPRLHPQSSPHISHSSLTHTFWALPTQTTSQGLITKKCSSSSHGPPGPARITQPLWGVTKQKLQRDSPPHGGRRRRFHGLTFLFIIPVGGSAFHFCPIEAGNPNGGGGTYWAFYWLFKLLSNWSSEPPSCSCIYHQKAL